jgi:hypothetical protein
MTNKVQNLNPGCKTMLHHKFIFEKPGYKPEDYIVVANRYFDKKKSK